MGNDWGLTDDAEADHVVHLIASDWRQAPLSAADHALCAYAEKLTRAPHAMTDADIQALRRHAFDDRAIHDATQVISYFNYINRIADSLGVEPETFVRPWEQPLE
ncbi:MAG: peroxidase [Ardenticatenales bacterium]|nr:peroxidase [Ardenticatenales bacterium]